MAGNILDQACAWEIGYVSMLFREGVLYLVLFRILCAFIHDVGKDTQEKYLENL